MIKEGLGLNQFSIRNYLDTEEHFLEAAKALFPYVTNVHVCHWIKLDKKPLSDGLDEWKEYFDVLKENSDNRVFMLEFMHDGETSSLPATADTLFEIMGLN